jgi:hypothetical protein
MPSLLQLKQDLIDRSLKNIRFIRSFHHQFLNLKIGFNHNNEIKNIMKEEQNQKMKKIIFFISYSSSDFEILILVLDPILEKILVVPLVDLVLVLLQEFHPMFRVDHL